MAEKNDDKPKKVRTPRTAKTNEKAANDGTTQAKVTIKRSRTRVYEAPTETLAKESTRKKSKVSQTPRELELDNIILKYVMLSVGAGTIPIPLVDIVAITGLQLKMVSELSSKYDIPFSENAAKSIIASLIGSLAPLEIAKGVVGTAVKYLPGVGSLIGSTVLASLAGASTYAVGEVFVKHFESGGTFLKYDSEKLKSFYAEQYEKGKSKITNFVGKKTVSSES